VIPLRLWETLWTDYFSSSFHLFIALAILEKHRDVIMDHLKHFDEVLKYSMLIPGILATCTSCVLTSFS
jgi:GTPase-activating protein